MDQVKRDVAPLGRHAGAGESFALRLALFYGALFLIYGVHVPYLPVWLDWRHLSAAQISVVMAAPFFIRLLITPAAAVIADRKGNHRSLVIGLAWGCLTLSLVLSQMQGFWPILLVAVSFHICSSTVMPLTETLAVRGVRTANLDYGRMRLWGSLTFIAVGLVGGALLDKFGPAASVWLIIAGSMATLVAAHMLPRDADPAIRPPPHEGNFIGPETWRLVKSPMFLLFLLAVGAIQAAHGTFYAFGALHWRSQGISTTWIGGLWAIAVFAEVVLFAYSGAVLRRTGAMPLIIAGGAAAIVRWTLMAFDLPLAALAPLQLLHALTYGGSHLGAMHFISRAVPEGQAATAQALYATVAAGVLMGAVTLGSGPIYAAYGGKAYFASAAAALMGLAAAVVLYRRWNGERLWQGQAHAAA